ncbi:MAG TPA: S8 family serine peptidase [Phycisphaerae bacterium]|nr:S8 family serine peptidase [Phycisphaerae bacterium]
MFHLPGFGQAGRYPSRLSSLAGILCTSLFLADAASAGQPDPAPIDAGRAALKIDVAELGIQLLPQPIDLGGGVRFLGTGPSPDEIRATIACNLSAADTTNANQLWTGGGLGLSLTGAGLTVGIWDEGQVRSTHQELTGRVTLVDAIGLSSHSTHVAGTIGATGVSPSARGMAGSILIRSRDWDNDTSEMTTDAALIQISNHSYGFVTGWSTALDWGIGNIDTWLADRALYAVESPSFGKYDSNSRALDIVLNGNPNLLCCWAAGNDRDEPFFNVHGDNTYVAFFSTPPAGGTDLGDGYYQVTNAGATAAPPSDGSPSGYDSISGKGLAKNCLTVGGIADQTADPYASISFYSSSGHGPVDDGRVKPDVVGNAIGLNSCTAGSNSSYASFTGTSMSTPNIAGTSALIIEHYKNLNAAALPRSATTKALLIHNAFDGGTAGPDYRYGWGLVDAAKTVLFLNDSESVSPVSNYLYETSYAGTTEDRVFTYSGPGPMKATLVWTDPPPNIGMLPGASVDVTTKVLLRDLDLSIIGPPGSTTYWPWTLDPANPTAAAVQTVRNAVDNVEQVVIAAPTAGTYTVRVSHTGTVTSLNYSLLVTNVSAGVAPIIDPVADDSTACGSAYASSAPTLSQGTAPITWSLDAAPALMTVNPGTGEVAWPNPTPSFTPHTVTVRATNGIGNDTETWQLTVAPGDFNGDGVLDVLDIPEFVDHLLDVSNTRPCAADVNLDTFIDGLDAQAFVDGI